MPLNLKSVPLSGSELEKLNQNIERTNEILEKIAESISVSK